MSDVDTSFYAAEDARITNVYGTHVHMGITSVANGGTITHGLGATPDIIILTPTVAQREVAVTAKGSTTFTVSLLQWNSGTGVASGGSGSITHGMATTPSCVQLTGALTADRLWKSGAATSTTIPITVLVASLGMAPGGTSYCSWFARGTVDVAEDIHWIAIGNKNESPYYSTP